jgi:hypothetical protein
VIESLQKMLNQLRSARGTLESVKFTFFVTPTLFVTANTAGAHLL